MAEKKEGFKTFEMMDTGKFALVESMLAKCEKMQNKGDSKGALKCYDDVAKFEPDTGITWYMKGACLFSLGKYDEAIESFEKAAKLSPERAEPRTAVGYCQISKGNLDAAMTEFKAAEKINSTDPLNLTFLAFCAALRGEKDDVGVYIKKAAKIDPKGTIQRYRDFVLGYAKRTGMSKDDKTVSDILDRLEEAEAELRKGEKKK